MLHVGICAGVPGNWHPYRDLSRMEPERRFQCRNGNGRPPTRSPEQEDDDPVGRKLIQAEKWS